MEAQSTPDKAPSPGQPVREPAVPWTRRMDWAALIALLLAVLVATCAYVRYFQAPKRSGGA